MSKELKEDQLEKVAGGDTYNTAEEVRFLYGKEYHVEVHTWRIPWHQFTVGGHITKFGYTHNGGKYSPCYYIECPDEASYSGWYDEDYLQDTTYWRWKKVDTDSTPVTVVG